MPGSDLSSDTYQLCYVAYALCASFSYLWNEDRNSFYLLGMLWRLNELIPVKDIEECLAYNKDSTNVTTFTLPTYMNMYCMCV